MLEKTLQLESLEIQGTSINIGETKVTDTQDTSDTQIQDDGTDSQLNGEECNPDISDDQTSKAS